MIGGALAIAAATAQVSPPAPLPAETPRPTAEELVQAQQDKMVRAFDELERDRAAASPTPTPSPFRYEPDLELPPFATITPGPLIIPTATPEADCSGPFCGYGSVINDLPVRGADPPEDRAVVIRRQILALWPVLPAIAAVFALHRFIRPRWRGHLATARHIGSRYWREIGLFALLAAILAKIW